MIEEVQIQHALEVSEMTVDEYLKLEAVPKAFQNIVDKLNTVQLVY